MKDITTIRIDAVLKQKAKMLGLNISKITENSLYGIINIKEKNDIDIEGLNKELEETEKKIIDARIRQSEILAQLSYVDEEKQKAKKERSRELERVANSVKASGFMRNQGGEL